MMKTWVNKWKLLKSYERPIYKLKLKKIYVDYENNGSED